MGNDTEEELFTRKQLVALVLPLIVEQLLTITVGIADTMMVSVAGEAAVSGASLVDAVNVLILMVLSALATGGAVVCSQALGRKDTEEACEAADQLLLVTVGFALAVLAVMLIGGRSLLHLIFGATEEDVMDQAVTYFHIVIFSYPFMAVYNSAAALFRSMGNSRVSMKVSLLMNGINVAGNAILIFGFHMGVAGAAWATLIARIIGSAVLFGMALQPRYEIHIDNLAGIRPRLAVIQKILYIGIPTGLENGLFQLGKLLVLSLVSSLGTASIMANSVASNLTQFMNIPGMAMSLAVVTVAGQCIGAGRPDEARRYTNMMVAAATVMIESVSVVVLLLRPILLDLYNMSEASRTIASTLLVWHTFATLIWPIAFNLSNALRAGNDVKFTLVVSMMSMWIFRVGFSYLLGGYFGLGVYGVWIAMFLDWAVRAAFFLVRYRGDKWYQKAIPAAK